MFPQRTTPGSVAQIANPDEGVSSLQLEIAINRPIDCTVTAVASTIPYSDVVPTALIVELLDLGTEPPTWTVEDATTAKAKSSERKR